MRTKTCHYQLIKLINCRYKKIKQAHTIIQPHSQIMLSQYVLTFYYDHDIVKCNPLINEYDNVLLGKFVSF